MHPDCSIITGDYLTTNIGLRANLIITSPPYPEQHGCDLSVDNWLEWMLDGVLPKMYGDLADDGVLVFNANFKRQHGCYDERLFTRWLPFALSVGFHLVHIEPMLLTNAPPRGNLRSDKQAHPRSAWEPVFVLSRSADYTLNRPLQPYRPKTASRKGRGSGRQLHYDGGHAKLNQLAQGPDYFLASATGGRGVPFSDGKSFPMKLPLRYVRMCSQVGDAVLDPFCGVGRTLFAARKLGRRGVGVEIRPKEAARGREWLARTAGVV